MEQNMNTAIQMKPRVEKTCKDLAAELGAQFAAAAPKNDADNAFVHEKINQQQGS